jgi:hypothetical protein
MVRYPAVGGQVGHGAWSMEQKLVRYALLIGRRPLSIVELENPHKTIGRRPLRKASGSASEPEIDKRLYHPRAHLMQ